MVKKLIEFRSDDDFSNATLEVSAFALSAQEHKQIILELTKALLKEGLRFDFIDSDSLSGRLSGSYDAVWGATLKLLESGWSFNAD